MDGVRQWCAAHNLSQYADRIIDEGYDTLQELCEIEEDDLEACGVCKRAHKKRALKALATLRLQHGLQQRARAFSCQSRAMSNL